LILTLAQNGAKDRQIKMTGSLLDVTEITFTQIANGKWAKSEPGLPALATSR
jgi:hypothetical protein